ncbi:MAG: hypothetical protein SGI96_16375 [Bacteroidota bacterium]|nr:hypothetical protein [Bacteroidota bacterium]
MSIRNKALKWFAAKHGKVDSPIYTSKFFLPDESWPKKSVWFPQIPVKVINSNLSGYINIFCEVAPDKNDFHYLRVPAKFLHSHLEKFGKLNGKIALYLSTDTKWLFIEERGEGNLNFKNFLV